MTELLVGDIPGRAPPAPSGAQRLQAARADTRPVSGGRSVFQVLTGAVPAAAADLARNELARCIERYGHPRVRAQLTVDRRFVAADLLHAANRALCTAPVTLARLAGAPHAPMPPAERVGVTAAVRRTALIAGINLDEVALRRLTDAALDALVDALAASS